MKSKPFFKNTKKAVVIIAGLLLMSMFVQCKKDDPENPNGDKNYGKVEIPKGMSSTDIVITNFDEDAIPDENGDFAIGYSKMLVAKNANNGNIMYFGLYSIDPEIRRGMTSASNDYELNAKETALYLALKLLPFYMQDGSDAVLDKMKESICTLPCVQSLESTIQNVVNTYGYLKTDEITDAVDSVGTFFYNEFSSLELKGAPNETKSVKQENLEPPYFNPNHKHGVKLVINNSQYNTDPQRWTINCTGYSSQFTALALVPGYLDENTNDFTWNYYTTNPYYLPPMSMSQYIELAENIGFLTMPGNWSGMMQLYRQIRESIEDPDYLLPYVKTHTDNLVFDIPRTINAIGVLSPKDTYFYELDLLNVVYIFVDGLSVVLPDYIPLDAVVNAYMSDSEFRQLFLNESQNGREGWALIFESLKNKLPEVILSLVPSTPQMVIDYVLNELAPIDAITFFMDASIMAVTINILDSFELPVVADFPISELPVVTITSVDAVSDHYARIEARIVNEGSHSISRKGVCYSTSPNPDLHDNVVEGDYYGYGNGQFSCDLENLEPNTTYYVRAYAENWLQLVGYSEEDWRFTTGNGGGGDHDYVDLGLPSGTLWATCNVGANSPEEYGDYFAWGETQPKDHYDWSTYQFCMGSYNTLTKYCSNSNSNYGCYGYNGFTDDLTTLLPEDDAATANWGNGWRMPTQEEWQELFDNTTSTWTTQKGVNGCLFTASNNNTLFLPAAGARLNSGLYLAGTNGYYWSSSLCRVQYCAWDLGFDHTNVDSNSSSNRYNGIPVRPVFGN